MPTIVKPLATEDILTQTSTKVNDYPLVRVYNSATGQKLITYDHVHLEVTATVDTSVNATTLIVIDSLVPQPGEHRVLDEDDVGLELKFSTDTDVVNTDISASVASIINSTAFVANADVVVANGTCNVSLVAFTADFHMVAASELYLEKGKLSYIASNSAASDVFVCPVAFTG